MRLVKVAPALTSSTFFGVNDAHSTQHTAHSTQHTARFKSLGIALIGLLAVTGCGGGGGSGNGSNNSSGSALIDLSITAHSTSAITFTWPSVAGAAYYLVQKTNRSTNGITSWSGGTSGNSATVALDPGQAYLFSLVACSSAVPTPPANSSSLPAGCATKSSFVEPYAVAKTLSSTGSTGHNFNVRLPNSLGSFSLAASRSLAAQFGFDGAAIGKIWRYKTADNAINFGFQLFAKNDAEQTYDVIMEGGNNSDLMGRFAFDSRLGMYGVGIKSDLLSVLLPNVKTYTTGNVNPTIYTGASRPVFQTIGTSTTGCIRISDLASRTCTIWVDWKEDVSAASETFATICPSSGLAATITGALTKHEQLLRGTPQDSATYSYPAHPLQTYWFASGYGFVARKDSPTSSVICLDSVMN